MPRYQLLALTNSLPGEEAEFERWYDEQHLPDVLRVPGIVSAQRYRAAAGLQGNSPWKFLTLYELDTETPGAVLEELGRRAGTTLMPLTAAMDASTSGAMVLECAGDVRRRTLP